MLVLSRNNGEKITIDVPEGFSGPIEVVLVKTRGDRARIGIHAPSSVRIMRAELETEVASGELRAAG